MNTPKTDDGTLLKSTDLLSSSLTHLVVLHRVLYGTIGKAEALEYLHSHLREDADLADMGRPLQKNVEVAKILTISLTSN